VVLVGERRPEQRHDAITHDLIHGALVAMDRLHHALEHRVQDLARVLGVAVGEQLHGALQVGEEHRHLLALALEGGPGGEDSFREVLGGVGLGGRERRGRGQAGPTLPTEFLARGVRMPAPRTPCTGAHQDVIISLTSRGRRDGLARIPTERRATPTDPS
jgi:hypothetical protein